MILESVCFAFATPMPAVNPEKPLAFRSGVLGIRNPITQGIDELSMSEVVCAEAERLGLFGGTPPERVTVIGVERVILPKPTADRPTPSPFLAKTVRRVLPA